MSQVTFKNISFSSHKPPEFVEEKNSDWVKFGKKNDYPDYLVDLFNKSAVHNAIITGKVNFICGGGITVDGTGLNTEDRALLQKKVNYVNDYEDIAEFTEKICLDYELFNAMAIEVIWSKDGNSKQLFHVDAGKIRVNKEGTQYAYSPDWTKYNKGNKKDIEAGFKVWDAYDPEKKTGSQLYYCMDYRPNMEHYPLPEYIGAVGWVELDFEISNYHYNNVKNGFVGGTIINFNNGMPSDELASEIERAFKKKFTGTDNAGGVMLNFTEEGANPATVTPLQPNNLDKQFEQLLDQTQSSIFIGHKITSPMIFGVKTEGQLGGRTEMVEAFELFNNTYVSFRQKKIEKALNYLMELNDRIQLMSVEPVSERLSEQVLTQILTTDELREKAGYKPIGGGSQEFKADLDNVLLEELSKRGRPADEFEFLSSRPLKFVETDNGYEPEFNEEDFRMSFALDITLTDLDKSILQLLGDNPKLSAEELAKALDADLKTVSDRLNRLAENGAIDVAEGEEGIERNVTEDGAEEINQDPPEVEYQVVYRYLTRPDAKPVKTQSRDFCRRLLALNRVYTRDEIDSLKSFTDWGKKGEFGSAWTRRGGGGR